MNNPAIGAHYLWRGLQLITQPGLRLFVLVPLLLNCLIFAGLIWLSINQFSLWLEQLMSWLPGWLDFLRWLIWPLIVSLLLVVVMYSFSIVANLIAAPFNGLLAEKTEELLSGREVQGRETLGNAFKDLPRSLLKELHKLLYYLPRALAVALLSLIFLFVFPPLSTLLWFVLGAWMMAMEYCDYPMENHRKSLTQVKQALAAQRYTSFGFGASVMLATMIPLLNFVVMPAAVCGATAYWLDQLSQQRAPLQ